MLLPRTLIALAFVGVPCATFAQSSAPPSAEPSSSYAPAAPATPWTLPPLRHPPSPADLRSARDQFQRGVEASDRHDYANALTGFVRAYELTRNPQVLYNIAVTYEFLGDALLSLDALRAYTSMAPAAQVARRQTLVAELDARLQARIGSLVLAVDLPGLEVRVDGVPASASDLRAGMRTTVGRHHIELWAPGREDRDVDVAVRAGTATRIEVELPVLQSQLRVAANVSQAQVFVDGARVGQTPLGRALVLPEGVHRVEVRRPGYTVYATQLTLEGPAGAEVNAQLGWLDPIPPEVGSRLVFQSADPTVHASLDGRSVALDGSTPVPPGGHRVRVERAERVAVERNVTLAAGRETVVDVALVSTVQSREARIRGTRYVGLAIGIPGVVFLAAGATVFGYNEYMLSNPSAPPSEAYQTFATIGIVAGAVGFAATVLGGALVVGAPGFHQDAPEPVFRVHAGLDRVGLELRF